MLKICQAVAASLLRPLPKKGVLHFQFGTLSFPSRLLCFCIASRAFTSRHQSGKCSNQTLSELV